MPVCRENLISHVVRLAETPRAPESDELASAREYVVAELTRSGWTTESHVFQAVNDYGQTLDGTNLIARFEPTDSGAKPSLCVGAHLDTRPDSPGADDNASGVAALLEIARLHSEEPPDELSCDLELVVFDLEEEGMLGGAEHARRYLDSKTDLAGMIALEMLGYRDPTPGAQELPRQLRGLYPDTGDFIAVIGNQRSSALIASCAAGMRRVAELPVETLAVESNGEYLQATRLSDHSPFWDAGFAALMITDTSFMRNPHYHTPGDTFDTLDFEFLEHVTTGCRLAIQEICGGFSEGPTNG